MEVRAPRGRRGPGGTPTALPVAVAHLQVAAGAGGVLAGALGAADVLDLLAQALEGGVHLQVAVAHHVGVIGPVVAAAVVGLLLGRLGQEAEVESAAGGAGRTGGPGGAGGTLREERRRMVMEERAVKAGGSGRAEGSGRTTGPTSPVRPRGPGGPMGPGSPFRPSLPAAPAEPGGPCGTGGKGERGRAARTEPSPPAPTHVPTGNAMAVGTPRPPCGATAVAGCHSSSRDSLGDRRDQKHQKDLVHQESPVTIEEEEKATSEVTSASRAASRAGGSARGHRHPTGLTGGPGGPWRPEKPL